MYGMITIVSERAKKELIFFFFAKEKSQLEVAIGEQNGP